MWSGVDPDIELYASGKVLDDDGEWAGAQSTTGPASAGLILIADGSRLGSQVLACLSPLG